MTRRRQMADSRQIFDLCVWGIVIVSVFMVLFSLAADAIDVESDMTEARVKAHVGRMEK